MRVLSSSQRKKKKRRPGGPALLLSGTTRSDPGWREAPGQRCLEGGATVATERYRPRHTQPGTGARTSHGEKGRRESPSLASRSSYNISMGRAQHGVALCWPHGTARRPHTENTKQTKAATRKQPESDCCFRHSREETIISRKRHDSTFPYWKLLLARRIRNCHARVHLEPVGLIGIYEPSGAKH